MESRIKSNFTGEFGTTPFLSLTSSGEEIPDGTEAIYSDDAMGTDFLFIELTPTGYGSTIDRGWGTPRTVDIY